MIAVRAQMPLVALNGLAVLTWYLSQCGSADKCQTLITKILGLKKAVCKVEYGIHQFFSLGLLRTAAPWQLCTICWE